MIHIALLATKHSGASSAEQAAAAAAALPLVNGARLLPAEVRGNLLLLTLGLLQRLQQQDSGTGGSDVSRFISSVLRATNHSSMLRSSSTYVAGLFTAQLLSLAGFGLEGTSVWKEQGSPAAVCKDLLSAAAAAGIAMQASVPAAADKLPVVWRQQAGAICAALEGYVRGKTKPLPDVFEDTVRRIVDLCCGQQSSQPSLLLVLVQAGSRDQQVAFFQLLVSLSKVSGSGVLDEGVTDGVPVYLAWIAKAACDMLTASAGSGSSDGLALLWLLLLGRCFLQWGAALEGLQRREGLAGMKRALLVLQKFVVRKGSTLQTGLSAAGYDVSWIVQGVEALAARYAELLQAFDTPAVTESVGGLIQALPAVVLCGRALAVPHCCINPRCGNASGPTEKGSPCVWQGLHLCALQGRPLLWQTLSGGTLEECAQAGVQEAGCCSCRCCRRQGLSVRHAGGGWLVTVALLVVRCCSECVTRRSDRSSAS